MPVEPIDVGDAGEPAVVEGVKGEWRVDPAALGPTASRAAPRCSRRSTALVHDRARAQELFDFEYVLEMYKPAAKRRWGYFALPVLHGDRLVGKLDAVADRKASVLRVNAIHEDVKFTPRDREGRAGRAGGPGRVARPRYDRAMSEYTVVKIEEIEEIDDGREPFRPVRHHLGITSFGVNSWTGARGRRPDHQRARRGRAGRERGAVRRRQRAREVRARRRERGCPGRHARLREARLKRTAYAEEPNTTLLAIGGAPGRGVRARRLGALGAAQCRLSGGQVRRGRRPRPGARRGQPEYAGLLYNVACAESLAGRKEDAIEHLRRSLELSPALPRDGEGRRGLRAAPRRARVQGARWLSESRARRIRCTARASAAACSSRSRRRFSGPATATARGAGSTPAPSAGRRAACRAKASGCSRARS